MSQDVVKYVVTCPNCEWSQIFTHANSFSGVRRSAKQAARGHARNGHPYEDIVMFPTGNRL